MRPKRQLPRCSECKVHDCTGSHQIFRGEVWKPVCAQCYWVLLPKAATSLADCSAAGAFLLRRNAPKPKFDKEYHDSLYHW